MTILVVLIAFIMGGVVITVQNIFSKDSKQSYLYVFNKETNAWDRASLLDLEVTLCDNLKVTKGEE